MKREEAIRKCLGGGTGKFGKFRVEQDRVYEETAEGKEELIFMIAPTRIIERKDSRVMEQYQKALEDGFKPAILNEFYIVMVQGWEEEVDNRFDVGWGITLVFEPNTEYLLYHGKPIPVPVRVFKERGTRGVRSELRKLGWREDE